MVYDFDIRAEKGPLDLIDCGLMCYRECLELQKQTLEKRAAGQTCNTVFLVEHEPVITLGAHQSENKLLVDEQQLQNDHVELVPIRRGGGSTAHNKGQLVIYPIVGLRNLKIGINEYIRELETLGMLILERLGVESERVKGLPGLWVGEDKIASIGVKVSRGVTYHGIAINIYNDLSIFDMIVPCGLDGVIMTSVSKLGGKVISFEEVKKMAAEIIADRWSLEGNWKYEKYR